MHMLFLCFLTNTIRAGRSAPLPCAPLSSDSRHFRQILDVGESRRWVGRFVALDNTLSYREASYFSTLASFPVLFAAQLSSIACCRLLRQSSSQSGDAWQLTLRK